ncbi:hypothetical protein FD00_GL001110 [Liquorilactobacillus mali KCTC 3596 = DSM 20444]|uniref:Uncharacterized protein n=2 Tax=Liquorilactobacillus mali TaxID=1618 RepID=A0A0R2E2U0_9LACO|nr:hypothetical protein FD00_GL001110 [Liquorilactobacillus mali KCTC 3596 = DSM 20444]
MELMKKTPQGYHELVHEYMMQSFITIALSVLGFIGFTIAGYFLFRNIKECYENKTRWEDDPIARILVLIVLVIFDLVFLIAIVITTKGLFTPNFSMLQQLLNGGFCK